MSFQIGDIVAHKDQLDDRFLILEEFESEMLGNSITSTKRKSFRMLRLATGEKFIFAVDTINNLSVKVV